MTTCHAALERLAEGNRRFVSGEQMLSRDHGEERRMELAAGQDPFAIILGCSDSRVPAEIVFDQAPGDLFVIRVAGNTVFPSQIGSVEYAVAQFGVPLVVVLGHSGCGAVQATLDEIRQPSEKNSPNLQAIIEQIRPSLLHLAEGGTAIEPGLMSEAVRANVRSSVSRLQHGSELLARLVSEGRLAVVGAEYSLETGLVEFYLPVAAVYPAIT